MSGPRGIIYKGEKKRRRKYEAYDFRDVGWAILGKPKGIVPSYQILVKKTGTSPTDRYPEKKFWFGCSGYEHTFAIYPTYQTAYSDLKKAREEKHFVRKDVVIRKVLLEVIS